jgi:drug/metabolite transporter (DMT)-like permease
MTEMVTARGGIGPAQVLAWLALLAFETLAQVTLKMGGEPLAAMPFGLPWLAEAAHNSWVWAGVAGYVGAFAAWMIILDTVPLSLGFPMTAAVVLAVAAASHYLFGEVLSYWRLGGIALIIAGLVVMGGDDS